VIGNTKKLSNPLALVVLVLLFEKPMHPYEMASTMRERHKEESIKLRYGSLYTVIRLLQREGLIAARETGREGRRPERTIYELTPAGRQAMRDWMREILSTPVKEYPQFEAGLPLLPALPFAEATELLVERVDRVGERMKCLRTTLDTLMKQGLDPLFLVEAEYHYALLEAEREFVTKLVRQLRDEKWAFVKVWKNRRES